MMPKKTKASEPYVIVRGRNIGVHAGFLHEDDRDRMVLRDARRLWRWGGAYSLSGLAVLGTAAPDRCRFAVPVPKQELRGLDTMGDYEVIHCTDAGAQSIQEVPVWGA
jgi:hypothetical protein